MAKIKQPKPTTVDFETHGIEGRPFYPPVPVGVSIKPYGKPARYYAWGHPTGNDSTWGEARAALQQAYACPDGVLFQNGKFDVDVADVHMGLPVPEWHRIHDTMFLLFLDDPHQKELGLKPAGDRLLGMPADEQDAVRDWLLANQPVPGVKMSKSKSSDHYFGRYIAYAPGDLVAKYADGDVIRTEKIFDLLWKKTRDRGMLAAYDRERRLMPILLDMERTGLRVDLPRLREDVAKYTHCLHDVNNWILKKIKAPGGTNLDSGDEVMAAMLAAGVVDEDLCHRTATGKISTAKDSLVAGVKDKQLLGMMRYRAALKTTLGTFIGPWLRMAEASGGLIHTTWNQVKQPHGAAAAGTRTGRLSATWFMNMPKEFNPIFAHEAASKEAAKKLPKCPLPGLPSLPMCRSYIVPFEGHCFVDRDYSQQEPRILGHFDGGEILDQYLENPWIDFHDNAQAELAKAGKHYDRRPVKNTNLGLIYGMGVGTLAEKNDMTVEESSELKKAILQLYPGLKALYTEMKRRSKAEEPIRTWGGREYYCEEPKLAMGRMMHFDYKMVNVLIQGSAADCTKEAVIRFDDARRRLGKTEWKLVLQVHDQLTVSVPLVDLHEAMEVLRQCMEGIEFDVPMLSEGAVSTTNWNDLEDYDKKGKRTEKWQQQQGAASRSSRSRAGRSAATATTSSAR